MTAPARRLAAVPPTGPAVLPRITERQLQRMIVDYCRWLHLLCYHTHDSRHSAAGFPDLVIVGPGGVLYRELKSETGRLSIAQTCWSQGLREAGVNWSVWRPADWPHRVKAELDALTARLTPAGGPR